MGLPARCLPAACPLPARPLPAACLPAALGFCLSPGCGVIREVIKCKRQEEGGLGGGSSPGSFRRQGTAIMYGNNRSQPCRADSADGSAWAPPNLPPPLRGGGAAQKKGSAFLHRVCAFLSSCMEIIPIGGNCFPDKREGAAGVLWVRGFGGSPRAGSPSWGPGGDRSGPYPAPSLPTRDIPCYWNETSCPAVPPHLPLVLSSPILHGSWTRAAGQPGSARGCPLVPGSRALTPALSAASAAGPPPLPAWGAAGH